MPPRPKKLSNVLSRWRIPSNWSCDMSENVVYGWYRRSIHPFYRCWSALSLLLASCIMKWCRSEHRPEAQFCDSPGTATRHPDFDISVGDGVWRLRGIMWLHHDDGSKSFIPICYCYFWPITGYCYGRIFSSEFLIDDAWNLLKSWPDLGIVKKHRVISLFILSCGIGIEGNCCWHVMRPFLQPPDMYVVYLDA